MTDKQNVRTSEPASVPIVVSTQDFKAQAISRSKAEAAEKQLDVSSVEGGLYLLADDKTYVNANGELVDRRGQPAKAPEPGP